MTARLTLTAAGLTAAANSMGAGMGVTLTRLALGSGTGAGDQSARTLLDAQMDIEDVTGAVSGSRIAIQADFTPSAAYAVTEIGLFAEVGADPEFLFAYWIGADANVAAAAAAMGASLTIAGVIAIHSSNTSITVAPALSITFGSDGGLTGVVDERAADYTVVAADDGKTLEVDASGGARAITLPDLEAAADGFTVTVIKTDASTNQVTIDGDAADTVNGAATYALLEQHESVILKWTGTRWWAIGGVSGDVMRDFFGDANRREFTTAGAHAYSWEWGTPNGLAILRGGAGGGGGGAQDNSAQANGGSAGSNGGFAGGRGGGGGGGSGGKTSMTVNGATYEIGGGGGGGGASSGKSGGGGGGSEQTGGAGGGPDAAISARYGGYIGGEAEDNHGASGIGGGAGGVGEHGNGGAGDAGRVRVVPLSGLTKGDIFTMTIGGGGGGGRANAPATAGADGSPGSVTLIPLF